MPSLPPQFRFNVREVEMGTRRPLIVQMVHDPTAQEPRCRLQNEDDDEYGPPIIPETGECFDDSTPLVTDALVMEALWVRACQRSVCTAG